MITLHNITRCFNDKIAVKKLSFSVQQGQILGLIGPNGAGKSTTMRMMAGFLPPTEGDIFINGYDLKTTPLAAKRAMGYLPESAPVYAALSVQGYLKYIAELRGLPHQKFAERLEIVSEQTQINSILKQSVETLSKGFRHRVCLAQALIHDPTVLLLDEPTDGLDPIQKRDIRTLFEKLALEERKTIVFSTHILDEVEQLCQHVVMIANGEKRFEGTLHNFRSLTPSNRLDRAFCLASTEDFVCN